MPLEIDDNGLQTMTLDEARAWLKARVQARLGEGANVGSLSFIGQMTDIPGEAFHIVQEALAGMYGRLDPSSAGGVWLDRIGAMIGSIRRGESFSTVDGLITFVGFGTVNDGDLIRHVAQDTLWAAVGGPYLGTDEDVAATFQAVDAGALSALAGSTWAVVSQVAGFSAFTNPTEDAIEGKLQDSDPEYRVRQAIERYGQGQGPTVSISAKVSKVNTENGRVETVRTYHNPNQNPTDSFGLPWKQTHVVVETVPNPPPAALKQDIWDALWTANGAGTHFYGSEAGTVVDSEGVTQNLAFDVVTLQDLYIVVNATTAKLSGGDGPVLPKDVMQMATIMHTAVHARAQVLATAGRDARELDYSQVIAGLLIDGDISGVDIVTIDLSTVSLDGAYTPDLVPISRTEKIDVDTVNVRIVIDTVAVIN